MIYEARDLRILRHAINKLLRSGIWFAKFMLSQWFQTRQRERPGSNVGYQICE
jgi:hypothetical protein